MCGSSKCRGLLLPVPTEPQPGPPSLAHTQESPLSRQPVGQGPYAYDLAQCSWGFPRPQSDPRSHSAAAAVSIRQPDVEKGALGLHPRHWGPACGALGSSLCRGPSLPLGGVSLDVLRWKPKPRRGRVSAGRGTAHRLAEGGACTNYRPPSWGQRVTTAPEANRESRLPRRLGTHVSKYFYKGLQ